MACDGQPRNVSLPLPPPLQLQHTPWRARPSVSAPPPRRGCACVWATTGTCNHSNCVCAKKQLPRPKKNTLIDLARTRPAGVQPRRGGHPPHAPTGQPCKRLQIDTGMSTSADEIVARNAKIAELEAQVAALRKIADLEAQLAALRGQTAALAPAAGGVGGGGGNDADTGGAKKRQKKKAKKAAKKAKKNMKSRDSQRGGSKEQQQSMQPSPATTGAADVASTVAPTGAAPAPGTAARSTAAAGAAQTKKKPCQHWARGKCNRGDGCRFEHVGAGGAAARQDRSGEQFRKRKRDWQVFAKRQRDTVEVPATTGTGNRPGAEASTGTSGSGGAAAAAAATATAAAPAAEPKVPNCTVHGTPCRTRVVVKPGAKHLGRTYHTCGVQPNPCAFFRWASDSTAKLLAARARDLVTASERIQASSTPAAERRGKPRRPAAGVATAVASAPAADKEEEADPWVTQTPRTADRNILAALGSSESEDDSDSDDSDDDDE